MVRCCRSFSVGSRFSASRVGHCSLLKFTLFTIEVRRIIMRKVSKSRTEDDVTSSTNGSVCNENSEPAKEREPSADAAEESRGDETQNGDSADEPEPAVESSKKKGRGRGRKKKVQEKEVTEDDDEEEEYEVEKVVDSKRIKGKLHYLIRWKGYSADNDTWEPENTLSCPDLISQYEDSKDTPKKKEGKSKTTLKRKGKKTEKATPKKKSKTSWDSENADENAEYEVDKILEVHHKKNGKREFLIHWKGWSSKFDSWEPENHLNCQELIKKFMDKVDSARSSDNKNLRVARATTNRFTLQDPTHGRRLSKRRGQKQRVRYDDAE